MAVVIRNFLMVADIIFLYASLPLEFGGAGMASGCFWIYVFEKLIRFVNRYGVYSA